MNVLRKTAALSVLSVLLTSGVAFSQDHHDDHPGPGPAQGHYVRHDEWHQGAKINRADWNRGQQIDYRTYHLNAPPNGYQWRAVDGNYVLAAVATGVIASAIVASTMH